MSLSASEEMELLKLLQAEEQERQERNEIFDIYRSFRGRYAVLIGGSGSGKSYEIADKHIDRLVHEDGHRILCVRAEQKQISESQFPLIKSRIFKRYNADDFKINQAKGQEKIIHLPSRNEMIFWGLDDPDRLRSIFDITSVWIEEADQTTEAAFRELDRRLRGYEGRNKSGAEKYMQISLSFNPVSVLSWLKTRFFDRKEPGQIMLHGVRPFTDCVDYRQYTCDDLNETVRVYDKALGRTVTRRKHNTLVIHSTYLDNKFIDETYHEILQRLKDEDEDEYNVFALGMWGVTGGTYFDKANVNRRILENPQPVKVGYFEYDYVHERIINDSIRWVDDPGGYIRIYEEPQKGYPYVGGGDTSGEGSDWNVGAFTNNVTGEDAATLRVNFDEDLYARQMYCLGRYYNNALIGIEINFSTHPNKELERLGYPNLYIREQSPDAYTGKLVKRFGFQTTKLTRPLALGMLRTVVREKPECIKDLTTLQEMTTFVKNEKGKPEAAQGYHDDCVMARAINCYIAGQQSNTVQTPQAEADISKLPQDLQEDYNNATPEQRAYLLKKWGMA